MNTETSFPVMAHVVVILGRLMNSSPYMGSRGTVIRGDAISVMFEDAVTRGEGGNSCVRGDRARISDE